MFNSEEGYLHKVVQLGIDVSKAKLDCTLLLDRDTLRSRSKIVPNTAAGFVQLVEGCNAKPRSLRQRWWRRWSPLGCTTRRWRWPCTRLG